MTTPVLGALSFSDTPDVNGSLVLTTNTGLSLGSIIGTATTVSVTGTSNLVLDIVDNPVITGTAGIVIPVGTTAQRPSTPSTGQMRLNSTTGAPEIWNGSIWVQEGRVLQVVTGNIAAAQTTTTVALANTAPTQTGAQLFSATFTPISATSRVVVSFSASVASSLASLGMTIAVFANAVAKGVAITKTGAVTPFTGAIPVQVEWAPGSTAAITITAYGTGQGTAATYYFNSTATAYFAGLLASQYTITEYA